MSKKLIGMDQKTRKWGGEIFGAGFEAGAQARVAAGIPLHAKNQPKHSAKIPPEYTGQNARRLWASGWKSGHAFGVPNTKVGSARCRRRALAWQKALAQRGRLRINSRNLIGSWRSKRGAHSKVLSLAEGGTMTASVVKGKTLVEDAAGKWSVDRDLLVLDYVCNLYGGETGALYKSHSVIMKLAANHFVIATSETMRDRYSRDR
jgi:hypothetical protein